MMLVGKMIIAEQMMLVGEDDASEISGNFLKTLNVFEVVRGSFGVCLRVVWGLFGGRLEVVWGS